MLMKNNELVYFYSNKINQSLISLLCGLIFINTIIIISKLLIASNGFLQPKLQFLHRNRLPSSLGLKKDSRTFENINKVRVVEVWMEKEQKNLFYTRVPEV